ncbi:MAG: hypothetical protein E6G76_26810 [Alphaproteobacteria bacterium]|nr:MAG: hypothetical protein E6G76_26810 [Alphaproteobacteria bacterium]
MGRRGQDPPDSAFRARPFVKWAEWPRPAFAWAPAVYQRHDFLAERRPLLDLWWRYAAAKCPPRPIPSAAHLLSDPRSRSLRHIIRSRHICLRLTIGLVRARVAVIAAIGPLAALAAKGATATIPIVFTVGSDPVEIGLVASLGRPAGNATGVNIFSAELGAKRLGLLNDLMPIASVVALLVNPHFPNVGSYVSEVETAARMIGKQIHVLNAGNEDEIDAR